MDSHSDRLVAACREAADDLGLRIEAPFLTTDQTGDEVRFDALVHDLGWPKGTLITPLDESARQRDAATHLRYDFSSLNTDVFGTYDRAQWVDLLRDWIWVGADPVPAWHRGRGWIADPPTAALVSAELARMFGRDVPAEGSIPHRTLTFAPADDVLEFLRSVAAGYSMMAVARWARDVHDRLDSTRK